MLSPNNPRVDFYIVPDDQTLKICCQLTKKIFRRNLTVWIHASNHDLANLHTMLWNFENHSFLPHELIAIDSSDSIPATAPIILCEQINQSNQQQVLINLTSEIPKHPNQYHRIAFIVANEAEAKQKSRITYRRLKQQQYALHTHHI